MLSKSATPVFGSTRYGTFARAHDSYLSVVERLDPDAPRHLYRCRRGTAPSTRRHPTAMPHDARCMSPRRPTATPHNARCMSRRAPSSKARNASRCGAWWKLHQHCNHRAHRRRCHGRGPFVAAARSRAVSSFRDEVKVSRLSQGRRTPEATTEEREEAGPRARPRVRDRREDSTTPRATKTHRSSSSPGATLKPSCRVPRVR